LSDPPRRNTIFSRIPGGPAESDDRLTFAGTKRMADIARCDLLFVPGELVPVISGLALQPRTQV